MYVFTIRPVDILKQLSSESNTKYYTAGNVMQRCSDNPPPQ